MRISQKAFDLIVEFEVSSKALYQKLYTRPTWPGVQSGVTIGIGYDVGYSTPDRLRSDWEGHLPDSMIEALVPACGVTGSRAKALVKELKSVVDVPWEAAISVFRDVDIPRWEDKVINILPEAVDLSSDSFGALVSLSYNRGLSYNSKGDRYTEMRQIRDALKAGKLEDIPEYIEHMKRIWPTVKGLQRRRDREAELFREGLTANRMPSTATEKPTGAFKSEEATSTTLKNVWDKWSWIKEIGINWPAFLRQGSILLASIGSFFSEHKVVFYSMIAAIAAYAFYRAIKRK